MGVLRAVRDRDGAAARTAATGSSAGAGRRVLDRPYGDGLAGPAQPLRRLELGLSPVQAVDASRALGRDAGGVERDRRRSRQRPDDRFHHRPHSPARRRRA